jgi:hypothetical protein
LPSSETPLSVTHRPEALRHRLAPGMPLSRWQYTMRVANRHAVLAHRQAREFGARKCDAVLPSRTCGRYVEAMCLGAEKTMFSWIVVSIFPLGLIAATINRNKRAMSSCDCWRRLPRAPRKTRRRQVPRISRVTARMVGACRQYPTSGPRRRVRPQLTSSRADVWHLYRRMSGELPASRIRLTDLGQ